MVRIKERYLLVDILYPEINKERSIVPDFVSFNQPTTDSLTSTALLRGIKSEVRKLFGDYGAGSVERSLSIKYLSNATSTFIVRVARDHYRLVWAALTMMNHVPPNNGKPCIFQVVRVSGTIRKAEEEAIRRAKALLLAARDQMAGKSSTSLDALLGTSNDAISAVAIDAGDDEAMSEDGDSDIE